MQLPIISINGTSPGQLFEQYMNAAEKCEEALKALSELEVHGRDYVGRLGTEANMAFEEHRKRVLELGKIVKDLCAIAAHVQKYVKEK